MKNLTSFLFLLLVFALQACENKTRKSTEITEMVKYLINKGVNKNKPETFDWGDDIYYGKSSVQIAKENNFIEIAELLKEI